ncbi:MAG: sugar ABC transporter ATP-binding protein [Myxococcota bacterium]|nr:sugar ABC transporter ATP-binding protein [Myxococcota bacterium]
MSTPRLALHDVRKSFGSTLALAGVELEAQSGEVHAVLGENGAGKSTLMKVLAGVLAADAGAVRIDGAPWLPRGPADARAQGLAMVHQELALCPHLDVATNVILGIEPTRFGVVRGRVATHLVRGSLARAFGDRPMDPRARVADLSVADRQLVEIARALATASASGKTLRLLVLDEPTSSLGSADADRLLSLVRNLAASGTTVLYVTHVLEEVARVAHRFTVLRDGKTVGTGEVGGTSIDALVRMMAGREVASAYPRSPRTPGEVVISGRALAGAHLPVDATFELRSGEVLGVAGLVGAGRTELLRAIFGLDPVRRGELRVGAYLGPASPGRRLAQGVGFASEDRKGEGLALTLSITENMTLTNPGPSGFALPARTRSATARWIRELGIKCSGPDQRVGELSGGNQQKVQLARLLHHDVDVLLLDEPTRGIDVTSKAEIARLCDGLASRGKAVLLVSSWLPELLGMADRIAVMDRGRLGPARPVEQCDAASVLREAVGA